MVKQSFTEAVQSNEAIIPILFQLFGGVIVILIGVLLLDFNMTISILMVIVGFLAFGVAWGLWTIKQWSYQASMIFALLFLFFALITLPIGFLLLFTGISLTYFLSKPEIKEIFSIKGIFR